MARRAIAKTENAAAVPAAALHRRRPRVVVRAPGATAGPIPAEPERRRRCPTLPGLGFRSEADTLPILCLTDEEPPPVSLVRARVAPRIPKAAPPPTSVRVALSRKAQRARPVTLIDGVHDGLARDYLTEAERLLASGIFPTSDD